MGAADLQSAFNQVAEPRATCQSATLAYARPDVVNGKRVQFQILTFSGIWAGGNAFLVTSDPVAPRGDLMAAAKATAHSLLESEPPPG